MHPQFTPPAGFPGAAAHHHRHAVGSRQQTAAGGIRGDHSRIQLQFGAAIDVFIGARGFGLSGHLGFDALLQIDPFHFDADISGHVSFIAAGDDLMSVKLDATLSGPAPWNIAGSFTVHIVFFDVGISFSHTWGDAASDPAIRPFRFCRYSPRPIRTIRELGWRRSRRACRLLYRSRTSATPVMHPLAALEVHESVVPLGITITHFGSAPLSGAANFTIGVLRDQRARTSPSSRCRTTSRRRSFSISAMTRSWRARPSSGRMPACD